jgi:hypothetical protein
MNYGITSSIPLASWHGAEIDLQVRHTAATAVFRMKANVEWSTRNTWHTAEVYLQVCSRSDFPI